MEAIRVSVDGPFDEAVERVKAALAERGFGTLSQIDVQQTLREKIGAEIEPYTLLGVCNPGLASRAIGVEHEVGVYMPCMVLVHQCDGKVHAAVQPPEQVAENTGNDALRPILDEVRQVVMDAFSSLK
jgi:uncharacterized protein (DUF302 family)